MNVIHILIAEKISVHDELYESKTLKSNTQHIPSKWGTPEYIAKRLDEAIERELGIIKKEFLAKETKKETV